MADLATVEQKLREMLGSVPGVKRVEMRQVLHVYTIGDAALCDLRGDRHPVYEMEQRIMAQFPDEHFDFVLTHE